MGDTTIGIKIADGSYYPILERGFTGQKRLVLTTAAENQPRVKIDFYRGNGAEISQARYIGSLVIENIPEAAQGAPEIELLLGIDGEEQLTAEATDPSTGESESFETSLADTSESDFELEEKHMDGFEEPAMTGEDYKAGESAPREDRRGERGARKGPSLILLILFVVLGVVLVAAVAYFIYRGIQGPQAGPLLPAAAVAAPQSASQPAAQPAAKPAPEPAPAQPAAKPAAQPAAKPAPAEKKPAAVSYLVKNGDTLWDLASTYYRNPWLYPRLARANGIKNPDLIFAGTRIVIPSN